MTRRSILWFLLLAIVWLSGETRSEENTLRQALFVKHLPIEAAKLANLDKNITSWAELDDADQYVIAFYLDDGSGMLNPPLFVDRFDRKASAWNSAELSDARAKVERIEIDTECLGSILGIQSSAGHLFLNTHINPSAGCVLVLSAELKLQVSLYGWVVGHLGEDALVYHRSEVHFAPVHPAEIAIYDLRSKRDITIFPPKPESPIRQARSAQLAEFYKVNKDWCTKNDDPCDPESFDSELGEKVATNDSQAALAFLISYEQIQLVQGDVQKPSGPKNVLYIYRRVDDETKMEYREMLLADATSRYGTANLQDLLQPQFLEKIFSDSPVK